MAKKETHADAIVATAIEMKQKGFRGMYLFWDCLRCGHQWAGRKFEGGKITKPKRCPKCNSPYWDKPRRKQKKEASR